MPYVLICFLFFGLSVHAAPRWAGGLGIEALIEKNVNAEDTQSHALPQLFAQMQLTNWVAHLELGTFSKTTETSGIRVTQRTRSLGAWGRYSFLENKRWRPFASLGVGSYFDQITSEYKTSSDERSGKRLNAGTGGGFSVTFWEHLYLDSELRVIVAQERKEPMLSALLRVGYVF